jgi:hypothetical protein
MARDRQILAKISKCRIFQQNLLMANGRDRKKSKKVSRDQGGSTIIDGQWSGIEKSGEGFMCPGDY